MNVRKNPVVPRLLHIAKNNTDFVTMGAFNAWAEAVGAHGLREYIHRIVEAPGGESMERAISRLPRLQREWNFPMSSRFDRYLPWVAREINRDAKEYMRLAKKEGLPRDISGPEFREIAGLIKTASAPARQEFQHAVDKRRTITHRFRAIVDWAEATGTDLGQYNWVDAAGAADLWSFERAREDIPQGEVIYTFDDGWTVQQLATAEELKAEGEEMQHCVGDYETSEYTAAEDRHMNEVWDPNMEEEDNILRIYSLRDPAGRPHATMEWWESRQTVSQVRGKQNAAPKKEYLERLAEFRVRYLDEHPELGALSADALLIRISAHRWNVFDGHPLLIAWRDPGALQPSMPWGMYAGSGGETISLEAVDILAREYEDRGDPEDLAAGSPEELEDDQDWPNEDVYWQIWRRWGIPQPNSPDEMVGFLSEAGVDSRPYRFKAPSPGNPSPLERHTELKRRLMR